MRAPDLYQPPITLTPEIVNLAAEAAEGAGRLACRLPSLESPAAVLRNRALALYGESALEGGEGREQDFVEFLRGRSEALPPREARKARNLLAAWEHLPAWSPQAEADLLAAHRTLLDGLAERAGEYRRETDAAPAAGRPLRLSPPAARAPALLRNLLARLGDPRLHPLVAAGVFHFDLQLIRPFAAGNGSLGRLWQQLILAQWNPVFAEIPLARYLAEFREEYGRAARYSGEWADPAPFLEFMLFIINRAVRAALQDQADETAQRPEPAAGRAAPATAGQTLTPLEKIRAQARKPLPLKAPAEEPREPRPAALRREAAPPEAGMARPPDPDGAEHPFRAMAAALGRAAENREYTSREIMGLMRLSDRKWFRTHYLNPSLAQGYLETTLPQGTTSRNQRYRVTEKGRRLLPQRRRRIKTG